MTKTGFRQFPAGCLYPPCMHAGYTLVSGSCNGWMDYMPGMQGGRLRNYSMIDHLPWLPALCSLGDLATARPIIVTDTREQTPLAFTQLSTVLATLSTGDYSFVGGEHLFAVERKSIADLVGCCMGENRERFERELCRLRGYRFKRLLVIGTDDDIKAGRYHSKINPRSVLNTLAAFEIRYDLPVVYSPNANTAARLVEGWVWWFAREIVENANGFLRGHKQALRAVGRERVAAA